MWIEIKIFRIVRRLNTVTPYAGVWIEIALVSFAYNIGSSLPTRECGLKSIVACGALAWYVVTPYAGVWIEMGISDSGNVRK